MKVSDKELGELLKLCESRELAGGDDRHQWAMFADVVSEVMLTREALRTFGEELQNLGANPMNALIDALRDLWELLDPGA